MVRLQKFLADRGIASRRKSEIYITEGRVKVNGEVITQLGTKVKPDEDVVLFDNKIVGETDRPIYIMLNKPKGYLTTIKDDRNRPTVLDLTKDIKERIFPVGRLDYETEGLLLLTNDGELAYKLTHPKYEIYKSYEVLVEGVPKESDLNKLREGIMLDDKTTLPAIIKTQKIYEDTSLYEIKIREGRNRQVRRMFSAIRHPVLNLRRIALDSLKLEELPVGKYRYLTTKEINGLKMIKKNKEE